MIIGVTGLTEDEKGNRGSAGAGKDLVSDRLVEKHGFVKVALADEIKRIAMRLWDFTELQLWGPSEERNKPDERYLIRVEGHYWACIACCEAELGPHFEEMTLGTAMMLSECRVCNKPFDHSVRAHFVRLPNKYLTPRHALQQIGTEVARAVDPDVWIRFTLNVAKKLLKKDYAINESVWQYERTRGVFQNTARVYGGPNQRWASHVCCDFELPKGVVVNDVRFSNEIAGIRNENGYVWRKKRKVATLPGKAATHLSEVSLLGLPDSEFNAVFEGGDLDFLYLNIDSTMDHLSGRIIPYDEAQKDVPPFKRK